MENEPRVSIILVNYNGYQDTIECIESLSANSYSNYGIVVVDNQSTDNSVIALRRMQNKYRFSLVEAQKNDGFSAGNNLGIKYSVEHGFDCFLLLNNDTIVDKEFLKRLVEQYTRFGERCALTGTIFYAKEPNKVWYAGGRFNSYTARTTHYHMDKQIDVSKEKVTAVSFISGCELFFSKSVLDIVGYMNEGYFLYSEDVDYSIKLQNNSIPMYYVPQSIIYHKVSSSTSKISDLAQYYSIRNRRILVYENLRGIKIFTALLFADLQTAHRLIHRRLKFHNVISGKIDYYRGCRGKKKDSSQGGCI